MAETEPGQKRIQFQTMPFSYVKSSIKHSEGQPSGHIPPIPLEELREFFRILSFKGILRGIDSHRQLTQKTARRMVRSLQHDDSSPRRSTGSVTSNSNRPSYRRLAHRSPVHRARLGSHLCREGDWDMQFTDHKDILSDRSRAIPIEPPVAHSFQSGVFDYERTNPTTRSKVETNF